MSLSWDARENAIRWYEQAGMVVFPYDCEGYPFKDWPNPYLAATEHRRQVASQPGTATYGAVLTDHTPVLDWDADRGGSLADLEEAFGKLPATTAVNTPGSDRNFHLFFETEVPLRTSKVLANKFPGWDFLARGSHVKGATSYRRFDSEQDTSIDARFYTMQKPILVRQPLPPKLLKAWQETQVESTDHLIALELKEAEGKQKRAVLSAAEKKLLNRWLRESLEAITEAGDGERYDALSQHMLNVYRIGMLLTGSTRNYDRQIMDAYTASGGMESESYLVGLMKPTRVFAAQHPKARPQVSAYVSTANALIGEWADTLLAGVSPRNRIAGQVVRAIAAEANAKLNLSSSVELVMQRHNIPKSSEKEVRKLWKWLIDNGWLVKTGQYVTLKHHIVNHYRLWQK
jgi:hypothetical protein